MTSTTFPMDFNTSLTNVMFTSTTVLPDLVTDDDIWPWRIGLFGVGGACIACVGVVGNCIAIIVLAHYKTSQTRSSAPFLLICLEMFDTIFLVSELFLENCTYMAKGGVISRSYITFIFPVYCWMYPVPHLAGFCATYLVVVITLERYIVVTWPLSAHRICRLSKAKLAVVLVLLGTLLLHIPLYMAYTCPRVWDNSTQREVIRFRRTDFGSSYYYTDVHMTWLNMCLNFVIPFVVLVALNTSLLAVLWRSKRCLVIENQRYDKEKKLTAMVVCMTCVFFVCQFMSAVAFILTSGLTKHTQCSYLCNRFAAVADTTVIINASVNFLVYCASGRKFRDIFSQLFVRRLRWGQSRSGDSRQTSSKASGKQLSLLRKHAHNETNDQSSNNTATTSLSFVSSSKKMVKRSLNI